MGFMNGMNQQMVENTISTSLGHVAVHAQGFQQSMKLKYNFRPHDSYIESIEKINGLKSYTSRIKMQAMIRSAETSRSIMLVGIDPVKEKKVSKIYSYTLQEDGSGYLASPNDDGLLISRVMAERLNVLVGDRIVVMLQDRKNELVGTGFKVSGIYESPLKSFDEFTVFTGIQELQNITGIEDNISEISIVLNDKDMVDGAKEFLTAQMGDAGLEILTWKDMAPNLVRSIKLFDTMMFIFFAIIFITVIFSIANTLIMAIMERFHEIGVMKSIGTRPSQIFGMVMLEAMNVGIIGVTLGIAVGLVLNLILSYTGINLSFYTESMRMWGTGSIIYPQIRVMDVFNAVVIVFFTTFIAAVYPAVKAARIKPLEALHFI